MILEIKAFEPAGMIPTKYTGFGEDISPEMIIKDIPENTLSLAIIMDDLDVPIRGEFTHWIAWNIPKTDFIPKGLPGGEKNEKPICVCQGKAWGKHIYRGPKQPSMIKKEHRYRFTIYALDCMLEISTNSNKNGLIKAMSVHVLEVAELVGRYKP